MEERRQKGLCFGCGAKWSRVHKCRRSQLYQMLLDDLQGETVAETDEFVDCMDTPEELVVISNGEDQAELSIHALQGTTGFQTMRIKGCIKNHKLIMLVDSLSTHNFLSEGVAKALRLQCRQHYQMGVIVANGEKVKTRGKCQKLQWTCEGHQFATDFMVLLVKGYDVILGVQWLTALGPVMWDFQHMTMQFKHSEQWITLHSFFPSEFDVATEKQSLKLFQLLKNSSYLDPLALLVVPENQSQLHMIKAENSTIPEPL